MAPLIDLMLKVMLELRELDKADRLEAVWRRVRLAYYQGAEQQSERTQARALTADELAPIVATFGTGEPTDAGRSEERDDAV